MSAWIVSKEHIDYMVAAMRKYDTHGSKDWNSDKVGQMLWDENHASVAHRYSNRAVDELPGAPMETYAFTPPKRALDPAVVLKQIACYEYQSCEHDGWKESEAHKWCKLLQELCIYALPGWDAAPWGIG